MLLNGTTEVFKTSWTHGYLKICYLENYPLYGMCIASRTKVLLESAKLYILEISRSNPYVCMYVLNYSSILEICFAKILMCPILEICLSLKISSIFQTSLSIYWWLFYNLNILHTIWNENLMVIKFYGFATYTYMQTKK